MTEQVDPRSRFGLYRLCDCPGCDGRGKVRYDITSYTHGETAKLERCPECRGEGRIRQEIASCETPEAVGLALVTLAREGEWTTVDENGNRQPCALGLLDREGAKNYRWLILPWLPSPRNISDAGRVLASAPRKPGTYISDGAEGA